MEKTLVTPVVLCGGTGQRLWPVSRQTLPKQFSSFFGDTTLFQETMKRLRENWYTTPQIVTTEQHRFLASQQLNEIGCDARLLIEPEGKNTAASIILAAYSQSQREPQGLLCVMPSDHHIGDPSALSNAILDGKSEAEKGNVVVFGVSPSYPATGFGYVEVKDDGIVRDTIKFHEKPDAITANKYFESGQFLWNMGIFLFRADVILAYAEYLTPKLLQSVKNSWNNRTQKFEFDFLDSEEWNEVENISFDYAFMEKIDNVKTVYFESDWSDLGDWSSIKGHQAKDKANNVLAKNSEHIDCESSMLWSNDKNVQMVGIGLKNTIAIATDDAILVAHEDHAQSVKDAVSLLNQKKIPQAYLHHINYRPWGHYRTIIKEDSLQVKKLHIKPHTKLSIQSHRYRSEHWVVIDGSAEIQIDGVSSKIAVGDSTFASPNCIHRVINNNDEELVLLEVQVGKLIEDDISRYQQS